MPTIPRRKRGRPRKPSPFAPEFWITRAPAEASADDRQRHAEAAAAEFGRLVREVVELGGQAVRVTVDRHNAAAAAARARGDHAAAADHLADALAVTEALRLYLAWRKRSDERRRRDEALAAAR